MYFHLYTVMYHLMIEKLTIRTGTFFFTPWVYLKNQGLTRAGVLFIVCMHACLYTRAEVLICIVKFCC